MQYLQEKDFQYDSDPHRTFEQKILAEIQELIKEFIYIKINQAE